MTLIVDFRQQSFNDALFSLEKAREVSTEKPFEYWKYCTWSIISSCMCMESYLTSHIETIKDDIGLEYLENYERESWRLSHSKGFYSKIRFIELITDSRIVNEQDLDWQNIASIIQIRNDIIHYNKSSIFNFITITNAENSIKACRDLVKKFHNAMQMDYRSFATWIDKTRSENYDNP